MGWEAERAEEQHYEMYGTPSSWTAIAEAANRRTRDVAGLRIAELTQRSADLPHRRREPTVINGEPVKEMLRERLQRETDELVKTAAMITDQLSRRASQLEHLQRFPEEDPFKDGRVLRFEKTFPHSAQQKYSYTASKINSLWYVSGGRSPQGVSWDEFVNWMGLGVDEMFCVKSGKKVIG